MSNNAAVSYFRTQYFRRPVPTDPAELPAWLSQELQTIQQAIRPPSSRDVSANFMATPLYRFLECDSTNGNFTVTLPAATRVHDMEITLKKVVAANTVTVNTLGGTIDGAATTTLVAQWASKTLYSDGDNWYIIAQV